MSAIEARIWALENDLTQIHRNRMSLRAGEQFDQLRRERAKPAPDPARIAALEAAMKKTEHDKADTSITEREVIEPLRERLAQEQAPGKKKPEMSR